MKRIRGPSIVCPSYPIDEPCVVMFEYVIVHVFDCFGSLSRVLHASSRAFWTSLIQGWSNRSSSNSGFGRGGTAVDSAEGRHVAGVLDFERTWIFLCWRQCACARLRIRAFSCFRVHACAYVGHVCMCVAISVCGKLVCLRGLECMRVVEDIFRTAHSRAEAAPLAEADLEAQRLRVLRVGWLVQHCTSETSIVCLLVKGLCVAESVLLPA